MAKRRDVFMATVEGGDEIGALLDELPKQISDQVIKATARKALKPVVDMAEATVRREDGMVADSIAISTSLSKRQKRMFHKKGDVVVYAGPTYPGGAAGPLIEFGTGPRYHKTTGKYVGIMPAFPFMRPAWDAQSANVLEIMRTEIWGVLVKAVRRLRKRTESGKLSKSQTKFFARR